VLIKAMTADAPPAFLPQMQTALGKTILSAVHERCQGRYDTVCCIGWLPVGGVAPPGNTSGIPGEHLTLVTWELSFVEE
jgi:hypothetical protein